MRHRTLNVRVNSRCCINSIQHLIIESSSIGIRKRTSSVCVQSSSGAAHLHQSVSYLSTLRRINAHPMCDRHVIRQSLAYLVPELTVCVTAEKVRCWRDSLQHFSIFIMPRCLSRKQQRLRPLSWRFACWMPNGVTHNLFSIKEPQFGQ